MFLIHKQVLQHYGRFPRFQECEQYLMVYNPWFKILMRRLSDVIWSCLILSVDAIIIGLMYWATTLKGSDDINKVGVYFVMISSILSGLQWVVSKTSESGFKIMVVSHRWENSIHPDPFGSQFKDLMSEKFDYMFYDYTCLPQKPRSSRDQKIFDKELPKIDGYYKDLDTYYLYSDDYFDRGWCVFEYVCKHSSVFGLIKIQLGSYPMGWNIIIRANKITHRLLLILMSPMIMVSLPVHIYSFVVCKVSEKKIDYDKVMFTNGDDRSILMRKLEL